MANEGVVVVFTAKTVAQISELGGSSSWVLNPQRMRNVGYLVCTRNDGWEHDADRGPRTEPRNTAFLVGKVNGIKKVGNLTGRGRYLVEFSDYAEVLVSGFRADTTRNPVTYSDIEQCRTKGIDIKELNFLPMPAGPILAPQVPCLGQPSGHGGLSIPEAKAQLALYFGVSAANIQITISG